MANPDLTRLDERKNLIEEITSEENHSRKREAQRRFDCYKDRGDRYIMEKLKQEFSPDSVANMRTITSINISKRVINALSSVYENEPDRTFIDANDRELEQLTNLYDRSHFNTQMKIANRYFNLYEQGTLYFYPQAGIIKARPLPMMTFDVVPDDNDPESAYAYVISTWDIDKYGTADSSPRALDDDYYHSNGRNEKIADDDDRLAKKNFIVWTSEFTFTMNGRGEVLDDVVDNPIGELPFIDFSFEKDSQFFVRRGSDVTEFHLDMGVVLSDIATISRNQGYAQGVVISEKQPKVIKTNHDKWLWLPLNAKRPELTPSMNFMSPQPDIQGSLSLAEMLVNMFLSARGLDTSTISSQQSNTNYSSGLERLLAMLDRFSASKEDFSMFKEVERQAFKKFKKWSNALQNVSGELELEPDLKRGTISDNVSLSVKFSGPEALKTDEEKLSIVEREVELGLSSTKRAIMKYYEVDEEGAEGIMEEIRQDEMIQPIDIDKDEEVKEITDRIEKVVPTSQPAEVEPIESGAEGIKSIEPRQALNGAQVSSLIQVIQNVAEGLLPRESALNIIMTSFNLSREDAESLIGPVGFKLNKDNVE